ncbi:Glucose/arabinose dehydrogenase, beta-propeller fold [Palleronia marisminoris]|uniref:Soluble aldose sugar dehydrogenase YliI n=1 Tax=Palleronia marisminoris TaxID=315423 RepID=A0A1Y5RTC8_9RHOB|nr:PQQ-dependent sugar dehydrogenase [Palleronia marisminoris]SFG49810.1 Glucose/arabinose dehydrogenase, beta-propeller fold [Palleronia marisminoris]SLN24950.1 Soluble aldose sugar dehydrogenase YliI precursor [Palleronia marisminoris]
MLRTTTILLGTALAVPAAAQVEQGPKNAPQFEPAFENQTRAPEVETEAELSVETVTDGLVHPWGIAVLPDGDYLVTERAGNLRLVTRDGEVGEPISGVPEVVSRDQGGLLDVALAPDFEESRVIFLTYAKPMGSDQTATAAARGVLSEDGTELTEVEDIFVQNPPADNAMHFGSRVVLDDGYAYITTGEHFTETYRDYAQDLDKTYGKIVRVTQDGEIPDDNPFVDTEGASDEIWTLGHRNIQGADIRPETGELWALEHGPAGGDELNLIQPGENYGWPVVSYGVTYDGEPVGSGEPRSEEFVEPRYYWDPVIAPGGFVFYDGEMFADWQGDVLASSLVPGALVRLTLDGDTVTGEDRLVTDQGRIRDVAVDQEGAILLLTDKENGEILRVTTGG